MKCTICKTNENLSVCPACVVSVITDNTSIIAKQEKLLTEQNTLLLEQQEKIAHMLIFENNLVNYFSTFLDEFELNNLFQNANMHWSVLQ